MGLNWPARVGFVPCSFTSLPSIFMKSFCIFCSLWGTVEKHFKPSGDGSDWPTSRARSPAAPRTGAARLWSLRSTCHFVTGRVSLGGRTRQPGRRLTASPSLEQAASSFLHLHNTALPHRAAGGCILHSTGFFPAILCNGALWRRKMWLP